jgi:hypothetical protein
MMAVGVIIYVNDGRGNVYHVNDGRENVYHVNDGRENIYHVNEGRGNVYHMIDVHLNGGRVTDEHMNNRILIDQGDPASNFCRECWIYDTIVTGCCCYCVDVLGEVGVGYPDERALELWFRGNYNRCFEITSFRFG